MEGVAVDDFASSLPPLRAGRGPAGLALLDWLDDLRAPRLCRVSGSPGSGRTHLIGWLAAACDAPAGRRPAAVLSVAVLSAAGLSLDGATWRLAHLLGVAARTPAELLDELREAERPLLLLVPELNRAAEPERIAAELLDPLLTLPHVRAVLEAATGSPEAAALRAIDGPAVLELDEPMWTDPARFERWYRRLADGSPFEAGQVYPNPGLARFAATVPAGADPSAGVGAAWWSALPDELRPAVRALAAADRPVTLREWAALPGAPDTETVRRAGERLPATGDFWWLPAGPLREAASLAPGAPLAEEPRDAGDRGLSPSDLAHPVDTRSLTPPDGPTDSVACLRLGPMLRHSVLAGAAERLLDDPLLLVRADPQAVTAAFAALPHARFAAAWRAAGPALVEEPAAPARAAVLRTRLLGRDERAAAALTGAGPVGWQAEWAHWPGPADPQLITAALGQGPYAGHLFAADAEGALRLLDLTTGQPSAEPWPTPHKQLRSLACLPDGTIAALDSRGAVQLLAGPGLPALPRLSGCELSALAALPAVGDSAGRVHWLAGGAAGASEALHGGPVTALDGVPTPPGQVPLLLSGGLDGRVRAWRPGSPPLPEPVSERPCAVSSVALAELSGSLLTVAAWEDGLVRAHHLGDPGNAVELRLGSPVRTVLADGTGRLVLVLPDGVVGVTLR